MCGDEDGQAYTILFLIVHEWSNGMAGVGVVASLTMNADSSMTYAEMVDSTGNSTRRGRH